jgi:hypothetical protein
LSSQEDFGEKMADKLDNQLKGVTATAWQQTINLGKE